MVKRRTYMLPNLRMANKRARTTAYKPGFNRTTGYYGRFNNARVSSNVEESKFLDVFHNSGNIPALGLILNGGSTNNIAQGTTESSRIGRKCTISSIHWRWNVLLPHNTSPQVSDTVRLIFYLDKQCNGTTATVQDILQTLNYQSFNNLANKDRFKILYDHVLDTNFAAGVSQFADTQVSGSFHKRVNVPIEFSATTGAVTEIKSNNLGILIISNNGFCALDSTVRLRFTG